MERLSDIFYSQPAGVWTGISLIVACLIFVWLRLDVVKRREREKNRGARMERLKQEAIEKLRKERDSD